MVIGIPSYEVVSEAAGVANSWDAAGVAEGLEDAADLVDAGAFVAADVDAPSGVEVVEGDVNVTRY